MLSHESGRLVARRLKFGNKQTSLIRYCYGQDRHI